MLVALSGCVETPPLPCATDCPDAAGHAPVDLPAQVRWEDCNGIVGTIELPRSAIEPRVPKAFVLVEDALAVNVVFEALSCRRAVGDATMLPEAGLFQLLVRVAPVNASWAPEYASRYVLDAMTSGPGASDALQQAGLQALQATLRADGTGAAQKWTFDAADSQALLEFVQGDARASSERARRVYHWFDDGAGGLRRVDIEKSFTYDSIGRQAGVLQLSGGLEAAQALPVCCPVWDGERYADRDDVWTVSATVYSA